jgi:hypothetical protein
MIRYIPLILSGVLLNAFDRYCLRKDARYRIFRDTISKLLSYDQKGGSQFLYFVRLGSYVVSVAIWLLVLARVEVSYAYPFLSVGYVGYIDGLLHLSGKSIWMRVVEFRSFVGVILLSRS